MLLAMTDSSSKLRNVLRINSALSFTTGLIGLIAASSVADMLGVEQVWLVRSLGGGLGLFAASLFFTARSTTKTLLKLTPTISFNDFAWVVGTIAVIALGWLSTTGAIVMGILGVAVLELGLLQLQAHRKLTSNP